MKKNRKNQPLQVSRCAGAVGISAACYGFALTAPVFEHLDNPALLAQEMEEDIAHGLVGKTAIHPSQVALIEQHYRVHHNDMEAALRIMDSASPVVFKMHDSMCEVATHRTWAHGVVEQVRIFGIHRTLAKSAPALLLYCLSLLPCIYSRPTPTRLQYD